jgi:hypothetical protein
MSDYTKKAEQVVSNPLHSNINPKYKKRIYDQDNLLSQVYTVVDALGKNARQTNETLVRQNDDLQYLSNDIEKNIDNVKTATSVTNIELNRKDCCCGYGYWPWIIGFIVLIFVAIALLVWT